MRKTRASPQPSRRADNRPRPDKQAEFHDSDLSQFLDCIFLTVWHKSAGELSRTWGLAMDGAEQVHVVGELIRLADGATWPLKLPITLIGSGSQCDVQMPAAGVAELHCALLLTPAGLALRSWHPESTFVNGSATAAALLNDGQELRIGAHLFQLSWNVPVEAVSAPALFDQLHILREQQKFDQQRIDADINLRTKKLEKREARLSEDERAVTVERKRIRALYQRCLQRIKLKWAADQATAKQDWATLEESQGRFQEYYQRRRSELDRFAERIADDKTRLQSAWELIAEGQRRTIADRQQSEDWFTRQRDAFEMRVKMFQDQQKLFESNRQLFDGRQPQLLGEIAGLETRATHLRQAMAILETKRSQSQITDGRNPSVAQSSISLAAPTGSRASAYQADNLLTELQNREQELFRERHTLATTRNELEIQVAELADQRAILSEQVMALSTARELWQSAEAQTVEEMHTLALSIRSAEQSLEERERELMVAERRRRTDDHVLVQLRFKLEHWHLALAAKESSVQSEADRLEAQLADKQLQMDRWEVSLGATASSWASLRERETAFLHAELDRLALTQAEQITATTETRQVHEELTRQLSEVAARDLALTGVPRGATRRVRVLEKRWKTHFRREEKRLLHWEARLLQERTAVDERDRRLQRETSQFIESQLSENRIRTAHDRERLASERKLLEARSEAELETQLRFRTEEDARRLRGEIARIAQSILTANLGSPEEPDVLVFALQPAQAA